MIWPIRPAHRGAPRVPARALAALVALAASSLPAPGETLLIRAGRMVDVADGSVRENVGILIEGDRIVAVGGDVAAPAGAEVIDLTAYTVLPGLIDSHTHICLEPEDSDRSPVLYKTAPFRTLTGLAAARADLAAGFTTLRDLDNEGADMADIAVRDAIDRGLFAGPRLFVAGWAISITAGHMNVTGLRPAVDRKIEQLAILADDRDAMIRAIRDQVKAGVDLIKIYATGTMRHIDRATLEPLPQFDVDDVRAMVEEAARWRLDVAAHAYGGAGAYAAVAGGVRSIEHGMFLDDPTLDLMAEKGTFWSPTMTVYLPEEDASPDELAFRERVVAAHRDTFRRAMKKGVRIAFGTDVGSLPHGEGWKELVRMADYGMPPMDVLRSATVVGAQLLRKEAELGRIAPGYLADMIAVEGHPDESIGALRDVSFVMVRGKAVKPR